MARKIDSLLNKKGWTGKELGRIEIANMVKLFAAKQRVFIEPYVKEGGSVSVSLQFNF